MIIFMTTYLGFDVLEYSLVFGIAILGGAGVNLYLTRLSDRRDKVKLIYVAAGIFSVGLLAMYLSSMITDKLPLLLLFGI
jgi:MFS family permease